jgi:hypothetical protein
MPITYRFSPEGFVRTECVGDITMPEVHAHFRALEADPATPAQLNVLLDMSRMTSLPESDQLQAIVGDIRRLEPKVSWGACAIVATSDALFGMSRMFEVFAERQFSRTRVFREPEKALRWLAEGRAE